VIGNLRVQADAVVRGRAEAVTAPLQPFKTDK
jgi:hypothetical protein